MSSDNTTFVSTTPGGPTIVITPEGSSVEGPGGAIITGADGSSVAVDGDGNLTIP